MSECEAIAPWFAASGNLTVASWDKLGKDLDFAQEQGTLRPGVRTVWRLVRSCLEDQKCCQAAIEKGQAALETLQEERSEKQQSEKETDSEKTDTEEETDETDSEEELQELIDQMRKQSLRNRQKKKRKKPKMVEEPPGQFPSAPPPCNVVEGGSRVSGSTFCPEVWKAVRTELHLAYPVYVDANQQRYHEPLDFKVIKSLAESVRIYGIMASFTVAQVEALHRFCMTPSNWTNLARACLSLGQNLDWKAFLIEFANLAAGGGQAAWDRDMLLGQGRFANAQTGYPGQVYQQINEVATKAWKSLPNKGEVSGNLTKILQGPMEPFSDFVVRLVEAAGKVFGDPDTAMPLIKQLAYEQCTRECRAAITPYKNKGLEVWIRSVEK